MTSNEHVQLKKDILGLLYKPAYDRWKEEGHKDDRRLFCNIVDMLFHACQEMENIQNSIIIVAFNQRFRMERDVLDSILMHFKEDFSRNGQ